MQKLPTIDGRKFIKFLQRNGFKTIRTRGSHVRMRSEDGRVTTIPVHAGKSIPKGLLRKIIREDLKMDLKEFIELFNK